MSWGWKGRAVWITSSPELIVPIHVEIVGLHQLLLFGLESAPEESFKSGLCGGPQEEPVTQSEMERGDEEAYGLHHVPGELPEGEPHEAQCLNH